MAAKLRMCDKKSNGRGAWRGRVRLAAEALAAGLALASGPASAIGSHVGTLDIVSRADGGVLAVYPKDGRHWVVGTPGQEYSLRVCNTGNGRVLAVMSVDGVNVVTGDTASPTQSGYVLEARECAHIDGWRKSLAHTAAFYFTELPDSYAARTGRPGNVGVVGVAFFREKAQPIAWNQPAGKLAQERSHDSTSRRESASDAIPATAGASAEAMTARESAARAVPAPGSKLGTGHGRSEASYAQVTRFERESANPNATIAIHYDRRDNLIAMGILPPPAIAQAPNPFPGWPPRFVPDPPAR